MTIRPVLLVLLLAFASGCTTSTPSGNGATTGGMMIPRSDPNATVTFNTVQAQRFVLTDAAGTPRGQLAMGPDQSAVLSLKGAVEENAVHMQVLSNGQIDLSLHDRNGIARLQLSLSDDGAPGLVLTEGGRIQLVDEDGRTRGVLSMPTHGKPSLVLYSDKMRTAIFTPRD